MSKVLEDRYVAEMNRKLIELKKAISEGRAKGQLLEELKQ